MSTIARKARKLARRLRRLMPDANIYCDHSFNSWGRSSYVYVIFKRVFEKVRISDHPVGDMRRVYGDETLLLDAGFKPYHLRRWLRAVLDDYARCGGALFRPSLPLFEAGL